MQNFRATVEGFYQVEELGEGVSEDGVWGQVTRAERWITILLLAVVTDSKRQCRYCLIELAILLTHFMKEHFNSFDDIQFFHTLSSISRDV